MPDCSKYEELCSAYVDHALSRAEKQTLEEHLAACPDCRAYVEELRALRALWRSIETAVPEGLHERIMDKIENEVRAQTPAAAASAPRKRRVPVFTLLAAAAACLVLAVSGSLPRMLSAQTDQTPQVNLATGLEQQDVPEVDSSEPADTADAADVPAQQAALPAQADDGQLTAAADSGADTQTVQPAPDDAAQAGTQPETAQPEPKEQPAAQPETPAAQSDGVQTPAGYSSRSMPEGDANSQTPMIMAATPVPAALTGMEFANCYAAEGAAEIPVIEGASLLVTEGGVSYYRVDNNESRIAAALETLSGAGFTVQTSSASPVVLQREAEAVLLMVTVTT